MAAPASPASATPAAPAAAPAAAVASAQERACPDGVLLCLAVLGGDGGAQDNVPVTFGHPLAPKLLQPGQRLVGRFNGATLPVQIDQVAKHYDGSVRFAVFSLVLPRVADRGPHRLELVADSTATLPAPPPIAALPTDVRVEIEAYASQVYELTFGNRNGHTPGIPFKAGEVVTLVAGEGAAAERFAVTIGPDTAGGDFGVLTNLAKAFVPVFAKSQTYRAHRDGAEVYETLWVTSRQKPGARFPLRIEYAGAAKIAVKEVQAWEPRARYVATLAGAGVPGAAEAAEKWLDGPLARETFRVVPVRAATGGNVHPLLSVGIGVRQHAGTPATRFEVVLENTFALPGGIRNIEYDAVVIANGKTVLEAKGVEHYAYARWRRAVWEGRPNDVRMIQDRRQLLESRAVPNYDPTLRVPENVIAQMSATLAKSDLGLMGSAFITRYMPMTGGRPDLGPLPHWSALHVVSQDPRLERAVLANGDASAAVPIHYRERPSGRPLNVAWNPTARVYGGLSVGSKFVEKGWDLNPYSIDAAHQPSLAYYPYLLTGDRFYLDELHFWASYNGIARIVEQRGGSAGLLQEDQLRGQAWSLRTLGHAALITPDAHALKPVFVTQLNNNLAWYNKHYATDKPPQPGRIPGWMESSSAEILQPWQLDYMILILSQLVENDVPGARPLYLWTTRFGLGRFLAEGEGFCRANAPGYQWKVIDPASRSFVTTWAQLHRLNFPDMKTCAGVKWASQDYPTCSSCYTSSARAALATMVTAGIREAQEPYDFIRTATPNREANFAAEPTYAIVPRAPKR